MVRWYATATDIEEGKVAELELRKLIDVVPRYIRVDDKDGEVPMRMIVFSTTSE